MTVNRSMVEIRQLEPPPCDAGHDPGVAPLVDDRAEPVCAPAIETGQRRQVLLAAGLLVAMTLVVFGQVRHFDFINYDDPTYVLESDLVKSGLTWDGVRRAFVEFRFANWHPLVWITYMAEFECCGGLNPHVFHTTNLVFHTANGLLLFAALRSMTGRVWPSFFVAALFAIHPLHVESVAWISELKDVQFCFFEFLALWVYARYARRPNWKLYLLLLAAFAIGLTAKQMIVTLPCVLLLLDYWPLRRWAPASAQTEPGEFSRVGPEFARTAVPWLIVEKLPLLALAAIASRLCYVAQRHSGALRSLESNPFGDRIRNAIAAYFAYLVQTFWPTGLALFYPFEMQRWSWATMSVAWIGLLAVTLCAVWQCQRRPALLVGWLWYLGTLVPVIGIVQVGSQARADRYTYFPLVGVFLALVWELAALIPHRRSWRLTIATGAAGLLLTLMSVAWNQTGYWQDSTTLFTHDLQVTHGSDVAHHSLGSALVASGDLAGGIFHCREALAIDPAKILSRSNLGVFLAAERHVDDALDQFRIGLNIRPDAWKLRVRLGNALARSGNLPEAAAHYRWVLAQTNEAPRVWSNLGLASARLRHWMAAADALKFALRLNSTNVRVANRLARVLAACPDSDARDPELAVRIASDACQRTHDSNPDLLDTLAMGYAAQAEFGKALAIAQRARKRAVHLNQPRLAQDIEARIQCYEAHQPFISEAILDDDQLKPTVHKQP